MRPRGEDAQRGFTLIELMVSLVLFSIAVAGILSVAVSMTMGMRTQRQVVAAEIAARAPIDFLADAIRGASPGASSGDIKDIETCASGAIKITDNTTAPDSLELVYASGGVVTWTSAVYDSNTPTSLTVMDAQNLEPGDYIVLANAAYTAGHLARITAKNSNVLTIAAPNCTPLTFSYPQYTLVIRAQRALFSVANDADGIPTLWLDPDGPLGTLAAQPLAEGIEDMQLAIAIDEDGDGAIAEVGIASDDDEWTGNVAGDPLPGGVPGTRIRALRITLVARTVKALAVGPASYLRPTAENRAGATTGNEDRYRRRVLKSTIEIRNMGGSP